jgi:hypothetical protein
LRFAARDPISGDEYRSNRRFLHNFREVLKLRGFFCASTFDLTRQNQIIQSFATIVIATLHRLKSVSFKPL